MSWYGQDPEQFAQSLITDEQFKQQLKKLCDFLEETERPQQHGDVCPKLLLIQQGGDEVIFASIDPALMDNRQEVLKQFGVKMAQNKIAVTAVFMITAGWYSKWQKGNRIAPPPSEDPNRMEIAMIMGGTIDRRSCFACYEIIRDDPSNEDSYHLGEQIEYMEPSRENADSNLINRFFQGYIGHILDNKDKLEDS